MCERGNCTGGVGWKWGEVADIAYLIVQYTIGEHMDIAYCITNNRLIISPRIRLYDVLLIHWTHQYINDHCKV